MPGQIGTALQIVRRIWPLMSVIVVANRRIPDVTSAAGIG